MDIERLELRLNQLFESNSKYGLKSLLDEDKVKLEVGYFQKGSDEIKLGIELIVKR